MPWYQESKCVWLKYTGDFLQNLVGHDKSKCLSVSGTSCSVSLVVFVSGKSHDKQLITELRVTEVQVTFICGLTKSVRQTAHLLTPWHTQPAARRFEPLMSFLLILAFCQ